MVFQISNADAASNPPAITSVRTPKKPFNWLSTSTCWSGVRTSITLGSCLKVSFSDRSTSPLFLSIGLTLKNDGILSANCSSVSGSPANSVLATSCEQVSSQ